MFDLPSAAVSSLGPSFSGDGKRVVNAPPGTLSDEFKTVIQADGKVVAAGYVGGDVAVVRFNPDGSLDTTFDTDGFAITDFGGDNDRALDVTVQPDGKIVIAGSSRGVNSRGDVIVGRYNVNGSLDTSFDGDGKVKRDFGPGDQVFAVEVDAAGKLVLAGMTNDNAPLADLLVVRLNANGSLDNSFDSDGSRIIDLGDKTVAQGMALDRSGRTVLAGSKTVGTDKKGLVIRLNSTGAYDTTFSGDGIVEEEFGGADEFNHVAVDDRGRVVAAGNGGTNGATATSGQDAIVARYTDAGLLDTSFGASGKRYVHLGGSSDDAEDMALDPFGRAVLVGDDGGVDFAVARLTADGALDTTFDSDGLVKIDFGATSGEDGQAVAIQADGKIVVVGRKGSDFAVARLSGGGTRTYALQDANFNTTAVTDATGKVLERYQYDAYGAVKVLNADWSADPDGVQDVAQPFLWQGGALVTATGTYHFRNRDVSSSLGRPTSADPWRQDPGRPSAGDGYAAGMSQYEWVSSDPISLVDATGEVPSTPRRPPLAGDWQWEPQAGNSRGGLFRDNSSPGRQRTCSYEQTDSHWDEDLGDDSPRRRYDRYGNLIPTARQAHNPPGKNQPEIDPADRHNKGKRAANDPKSPAFSGSAGGPAGGSKPTKTPPASATSAGRGTDLAKKVAKRGAKFIPIVTAPLDYMDARDHGCNVVVAVGHTVFEQFNPTPITMLDLADALEAGMTSVFLRF